MSSSTAPQLSSSSSCSSPSLRSAVQELEVENAWKAKLEKKNASCKLISRADVKLEMQRISELNADAYNKYMFVIDAQDGKDVLYRKAERKKKKKGKKNEKEEEDESYRPREVVACENIISVLRQHHDNESKLGICHAGWTVCYNVLKEHYYGIDQTVVEAFCKHCTVCAEKNQNVRTASMQFRSRRFLSAGTWEMNLMNMRELCSINTDSPFAFPFCLYIDECRGPLISLRNLEDNKPLTIAASLRRFFNAIGPPKHLLSASSELVVPEMVALFTEFNVETTAGDNTMRMSSLLLDTLKNVLPVSDCVAQWHSYIADLQLVLSKAKCRVKDGEHKTSKKKKKARKIVRKFRLKIIGRPDGQEMEDSIDWKDQLSSVFDHFRKKYHNQSFFFEWSRGKSVYRLSGAETPSSLGMCDNGVIYAYPTKGSDQVNGFEHGLKRILASQLSKRGDQDEAKVDDQSNSSPFKKARREALMNPDGMQMGSNEQAETHLSYAMPSPLKSKAVITRVEDDSSCSSSASSSSSTLAFNEELTPEPHEDSMESEV